MLLPYFKVNIASYFIRKLYTWRHYIKIKTPPYIFIFNHFLDILKWNWNFWGWLQNWSIGPTFLLLMFFFRSTNFMWTSRVLCTAPLKIYFNYFMKNSDNFSNKMTLIALSLIHVLTVWTSNPWTIHNGLSFFMQISMCKMITPLYVKRFAKKWALKMKIHVNINLMNKFTMFPPLCEHFAFILYAHITFVCVVVVGRRVYA